MRGLTPILLLTATSLAAQTAAPVSQGAATITAPDVARRSLPLPALAEQAGCGETANQPQKMYPYVMRLTLNHDGCD